MGQSAWALGGIVIVAMLTFYLGWYSSRKAITTPDFLVARRTVRANQNAAAISGEYLSAASFLSVAGLVLKDGADALWYPIGFTAGYLALLLFVAAPLRRSGAYTLPDFAEARLGSTALRRLSTGFVVIIGLMYLVPQFQGAGLTLNAVSSVPAWVGAVVVAAVVMVNVLGGGMRAITVVQAFQYWVKLFAIALPAFVLFAVFFTDQPAKARPLSAAAPPSFTHATEVTVRSPVRLRVAEPVRLSATGAVDGAPANGPVYWGRGLHDVDRGTTLRFPAGASAPVVDGNPPTNALWLHPEAGGARSLFATYSLIFATFLGTMGLPHVLVRFYTNPDGRAARRTTLHVLWLLALFYAFPTVLGALSRLYLPQLLVTGQTDAAVLLLPNTMLPNVVGRLLGAIVAAGAFAAFLSTSSGLVVSLAGVLSTDVLPGRVRDFRVATLIAGSAALLLAVPMTSIDISRSVSLAFAVAASTFCPLLVLGIWWRGLTAAGAAAGMVVGGGLAVAAAVVTSVSSLTGGWASPLLYEPALVSVPVAFLTMVAVSKATSRRLPPDVGRIVLRLHAPDRLGFVKDRDVARFGSPADGRAATDGRHRLLRDRSHR
ncbi:sodium/solute symporter [Gandjariella thermophila]|nr:cation acetate symporter [Gandjariella thermophila]